jgi:hypothetical protein
MENEKKSRREALRLIGKTGLFLGTVPVFFTSLKIAPESETGLINNLPGTPQTRTTSIQEKAFISGSGSSLTVKVTGKPGRVFFVAFAGQDVKENYRRLPGSESIINSSGTGSVVINTKNITNTRIYVKVITGEKNNLNTQLAETEAFIITTKEGVINTFEGVVSRPILDSKNVSSSILIAMAAATTGTNNSFQLR